MKTKSSLDVIDRALVIYQNPDDFLFGSFLAEEIENLGATTVFLLTGIEKRSRSRARVLTYTVENKTEIVDDGAVADNGNQREREDVVRGQQTG
jgi:hypothetical protein